MFVNKESIDKYTARKIAEAMNCWAGKEYRREVITPEEVMKLTPVATHEANGYVIYPYQWGDVTILVWLRKDGSVVVKNMCW